MLFIVLVCFFAVVSGLSEDTCKGVVDHSYTHLYYGTQVSKLWCIKDTFHNFAAYKNCWFGTEENCVINNMLAKSASCQFYKGDKFTLIEIYQEVLSMKSRVYNLDFQRLGPLRTDLSTGAVTELVLGYSFGKELTFDAKTTECFIEHVRKQANAITDVDATKMAIALHTANEAIKQQIEGMRQQQIDHTPEG